MSEYPTTVCVGTKAMPRNQHAWEIGGIGYAGGRRKHTVLAWDLEGCWSCSFNYPAAAGLLIGLSSR